MRNRSFLAMVWIMICTIFALSACAEETSGSDQTTETRDCVSGDSADCDGDGFSPGEGSTDDCDDSDAAVNPDHQEVCDGKDNNCDGIVDNVLGRGSACNTNLCGDNGHMDCIADNFVCVATPQVETCNGLDDDCDGIIDNGCCYNVTSIDSAGKTFVFGDACQTGQPGICKNGHGICGAGNALSCAADIQASTEICDGQDNDCDGTTDNVVEDGHAVGDACDTGVPGICAPGQYGCTVDGPSTWSFTCQQTFPQFPMELCNGTDQNCNGVSDADEPIENMVGAGDKCADAGGCNGGPKFRICDGSALTCVASLRQCCIYENNMANCNHREPCNSPVSCPCQQFCPPL